MGCNCECNGKFEAIRSAGKYFALLINEIVPDGRELSLALTKIEEAVFWGNAGLVRNQ